MRTSVVALSIVLLAACSSDSSPRPVFGGFAPAAQTAVIFAPATCDLPFVGTASISGVGIAFTSSLDPCAILAQTRFCGTEASSTAILAVAVSGLVGAGPVDPAGAGTYPFLANPPTSGAFRAIAADAAKVDATCSPLPGGSLDLRGGEIVLASVDGAAGGAGVTGSVDLRFDDGSAFEHGVDAAVCDVSIDVCGLFFPCSHVCVPPP
jgi:hypothetical protein